MKKLLLLFSVILIVLQALGQAPQKMSFQAVIRKSNNGLVMMQQVSMRISILQGSSNGTIVYQETHKPITNSNGLVTLEIGTGTIITGTFSSIKWGVGPYFIKTETDPFCGTDYTIVGVSEFLSVPYALFALNAVGLQGPKGDIGLTGAQGLTGLTGASGTQGLVGLNGVAGIQGLQGLQGIQGLNGLIGATGTQGLSGSKGATGPQGFNGTQGLTGTTGLQGVQGNTGAIGSIGAIGPKGPQGANGNTGTNGATGPTGLKGTIGLTGLIGNTGLQGIIGLTGATGLAGAIGSQGAQGSNGIAGTNGSNGVDGATGPTGLQGIIGLTGLIGSTGATGLTGANGIVGTNGSKGVDGATGPTGLQGIIGLTGNTGSQGLAGAIGSQGPQGSNGIAGTNGSNGVDGATGSTGLQGIIGLTGLTGNTGLQGIIGITGATGLAGAIGSQGPQGSNGTAGTNGSNGVDGAIGPQGIIGLTGSMGPQGDIGLTGPTGGFNPASTLLPQNGGTGIRNDDLSTLTITGANPMTFTNTGVTTITLPTSGTLYGTATASISSLELINSLSNKTGTGDPVFAISPAFTSTPTAPTAIVGTSTTQLATTEFVMQNNSPKEFSIASGTEISTTISSDVIAGNMTLTPGAGKYFVTFNSQYTIAADLTGQSKIDLSTTYNYLLAKTNTATHGVTYVSGETLNAGVYATTGASTAGGTITLDGQSNPNAEFIFKFDAAFSTSAGTTIQLINGASACNVYWIAEGAIALGASTNMKGTLISNNGAVSSGSLSNIEGRMYSNNGAIGLDATTLSLPIGCTSPTNYGMANNFAAFTSSGAVNNVGSSVITGDIGTNLGAITGFAGSATINGNYYLPIIPTSSTTASFSIYQNGALIPFSTRTRISSLNLAEISLTATATVGASEAIDIRWKIDAGTIKLQNRILTLIAVK